MEKKIEQLEKEKKEYYQKTRSANRNLARLTGIYERKCESFDKLEDLLKEACKELHGSKLYDESIGVHTYCISEPEQKRWKGFKDFLNKPEIKKIMEKVNCGKN